MDKQEYKIKLDQINKLAEDGDFKGAADIVDTIDWRHVKSLRTLCMVAEIYEANKRYDDAMRIMKYAYRRSSSSKTVLYRLAELSIRQNDPEGARAYAREFEELSPNDSSKYILRYKIARADGRPLPEQIRILEELKEREYTERWAYELARLYYRSGQENRCVDECDDMILWFSEGRYVTKAMELKMQIRPLTPAQQKKYEARYQTPAASVGTSTPTEFRSAKNAGFDTVEQVIRQADDEDIEREPLKAGAAIDLMDMAAAATIPEDKAAGSNRAVSKGAGGFAFAGSGGDRNVSQARLADSIRAVFSGIQDPETVRLDDTYDINSEAFTEDDVQEYARSENAGMPSYNVPTLEAESIRHGEVVVPPAAETAEGGDGQMTLDDYPGKAQGELDLKKLFAETTSFLASEIATGDFEKTDALIDEAAEPVAKAVEAAAEPAAEAVEAAAEPAAEAVTIIEDEEYDLPTEEEIQQIVEGAAEKTEETAAETVGEAEEAVEESVDEAEEVVEEAAEEAADAAEGIAQTVGFMAAEVEDGLDAIEDAAEPVVNKVAEAGEPALEKFEEVTEPFFERIEKAVAPLVEKISDITKPVAGKIEETVEEFAEPFEDAVKEMHGNIPEGIDVIQEKAEEVFEKGEEKIADIGEETIELTPEAMAELMEEPGAEAAFYAAEAGVAPEVAFAEAAAIAAAKAAAEGSAGKAADAAEEAPAAAEEAVGEIADAAEEAPAAAEEAAGEIADAVEEAPAAAEEAAGEIADAVEEAAGEIADAVEEIDRPAEQPAPATHEIIDDVTSELPTVDDKGEPAEAPLKLEINREAAKAADESLGLTREYNFMEELQKAMDGGASMSDAAEMVRARASEEAAGAVESTSATISDTQDLPVATVTNRKALNETAAEMSDLASVDELYGDEEGSKSIIENIMEEPERFEIVDVEPRRLDDTEMKVFTYFSKIPGIAEQVTEAIADVHNNSGDKTSRSGNIVMIGRQGSGKTRLADALVLAICRDLNIQGAKLAHIIGEDLNKKDPAQIVAKMSGGFLVIEGAGAMSQKTVECLNAAMEFRTDDLVIILEDEKKDVLELLKSHPAFAEKFTSYITIPVFTNDELVTFGKTYCKELGYKMDEMCVLALYTMIGDNQKDREPVTVGKVRDMIDAAIARAEKGSRRFGRKFSRKETDPSGRVILHEKDFNF